MYKNCTAKYLPLFPILHPSSSHTPLIIGFLMHTQANINIGYYTPSFTQIIKMVLQLALLHLTYLGDFFTRVHGEGLCFFLKVYVFH